MKRFDRVVLISFWAAAFLSVTVDPVFAADANPGWRATWDLVLRWINFAVLGFLILKVGRAPLKGFLTGQKEKIAREIKKKENEKAAATKETEEILTALNEAETRFAGIKDRIVNQGEKRKQKIIGDAKEQSAQVIEDAKRRIEGQILQEKQRLKLEILDSAIDLAMERLPKEFTEEDDKKLFDRFLTETATE